jgi:hypothetical protein
MRLLGIIIIAAAMAFVACSGAESGAESGGETTVTISPIPGVVVPVRGAVPVNAAIETTQYTGDIFWSPSENPFSAVTVYTANIFLTAKDGFTMTGVAANLFTVAGATTVTNPEDSGHVTAVFPATGAAQDIDVTFLSATQNGGVSCTADSTGLFLYFDKNPGTLTADNITVTGATKGILIGPGTTMYLAISNITVANGATISVTITSPAGYSITGSPQTAVVYRTPYIGMAYKGGIVFYVFQPGDPGFVSGETHGLIAATVDQSTGIIWSLPAFQSTAVPGGTGTSLRTGLENTINIVGQNGVGTTYAAGLARAYNGGGFTDWYLPSRDELHRLYLNRAAVGWLEFDWYWSSSEDGATVSWTYNGWNGEPWSGSSKSDTHRVRAIRAF